MLVIPIALSLVLRRWKKGGNHAQLSLSFFACLPACRPLPAARRLCASTSHGLWDYGRETASLDARHNWPFPRSHRAPRLDGASASRTRKAQRRTVATRSSIRIPAIGSVSPEIPHSSIAPLPSQHWPTLRQKGVAGSRQAVQKILFHFASRNEPTRGYFENSTLYGIMRSFPQPFWRVWLLEKTET